MTQFRKKPVVVEAVQLLWSTWDEMCEHAGVGKLADGKPEGCYVDANGLVTSDTNGRIGLRIPTREGAMLGVEGDWIVRGPRGELYPCKPDALAEAFEPIGVPEYLAGVPREQLAEVLAFAKKLQDKAVAPHGTETTRALDLVAALSDVGRDLVREAGQDPGYNVDFEPDWAKYPKLADTFKHRPRENFYWGELRELLAEARADAVQYVHDVRVEELAKARADERERLLAMLGVSGNDARLTGVVIGDVAVSVAVSVAKMVWALPAGQLLQALKNVGCYLDTCDACAEVFFTGAKMHSHTCQVPDVETIQRVGQQEGK